MKKIKLLLTSLMLLVFGVTGAYAQDYASTHTSNVKFTVNKDDKSYADKIIIDGTTYDACKLGTASVVGVATFKIPAGTTTIHLHVAGWKGKSSAVNFTAPTGVTLNPASITATSDNGIANNTPYTLAGDATSYYKTITISGATEETTITMTSVSGKTRVVIWGVNTVAEVVEEDPDAVKYTVTAEANDATMGIVSGSGEYATGKTATLEATPNAGYKFVNWSNGETANPLKLTVTENVEITANFEAIPPMTCAEASAAAKDEVVVLNPFDVVYAVKDAGYIYIKDESGVALIFDYTLDGQLKAGDHVEGFVGVSSPYNGLPEIKPSVTFADLTITPGTTTAPTVMATAPTAADVNKYIKLEKVTFSSAATFATSSATNATMVVNGTNVTLRNQFKLSKSFVKNGVYDITGFAAVYNSTVQIYYLSAAKLSITISATATGGKVTGTGEYMEGDEATLTATANEGYEFVGWTWGNDTVCKTAEYKVTVEEAMALVANFKKLPYNVTVTAENGTVAGAGEYEENAEATLTAKADEGYEFTCWTSGEDTVSTANPYTFAVTANVALVANFKEVVVEPTTETVYFIDVKKWGKVNAYAWNTNGDNGWPGKAATKEAEQIAGFDVYSFTANAGQYANVIFNNKVGDTGSQTSDLVWTAGQYYVMDMNWMTKEEAETKLAAPLPETWNIVGAAGLMGKDWDLNAAENAMTKQEDGTYKLEKKDITITAGSYEYKAAKDHGWDVSVPSGHTNQKLTISKSGIYDLTFVLDVTAKKLTATATLKKEAVVIPDVIIAGEMNSWSTTKDKFTMAADSLTATFKATLAVKNYGFKMIVGGAWHSDGKTITRAANSTKFTGANSNTNSTLKADIAGEYLFTWEYATKTLTVTYPELPVEYTVTATVNPAETGTVAGAGKYEEGKTATLTATPAEGYEFVNWTVGEEVVSTENPYTFTVTADTALVANFKEVVNAIEVNVTGATASVNGQNIDINAQWNEQSMLIMLWQGGATQGFGTYAAEDYGPIMLGGGMKEWTPTTEGVYADNGDGTFTFTCSATDGTTQYNITVTGNNPTQGGGDEEYQVIDDVITNLTFNSDELTFAGGPSEAYGIELYLVLGEEDGMGTFTLTEASEIYVQGSPATFISGNLTVIDPSAPAANAVIVAKLPDGSTFEFHIAMSSTPVDATVIVVENATVAIDSTFKFNNPVSGDVYEYSLTMSGNWTDSTNTTYLVTVEFPFYDPATTEEQERLANVKVGDLNADDAPFLGMVEDYLTITNVNGVITAQGIVAQNGLAFDLTISGTLSQGPSTGVENLNGTVAPVKVIENGQIFIIRNGVKYNAQGAKL